jgi:hypothetical protein
MAKGGKKKERKEPSNGFWDKALHFVRNPIAAVLALLAAAIIAITTGVGSWISDKASEITQAGCEAIGLCEGEPTEPWLTNISTQVRHCATGRLVWLLRDEQSVTWKAGAERLVICGDAQLSSLPAELPAKLAEAFPDCLAVSTEPKLTVATKLDSRFVCRAPYRFKNDSLESTDLPSGLLVCIPGVTSSVSQPTFTQDKVNIPVCTEDALENANFL